MVGFLIALGTFLPMIVVLVVVHEWGHFFTAKKFGVKVREFGIGYPPRAFGLYTGRTPVRIDEQTRYVNLEGTADLRPGQVVTVRSTEDKDGNLVARVIEAQMKNPPKEQPSSPGFEGDELLEHEGRLRQVDGNTLVLADMIYSLNYLPLGGFVRLAGESDPAVPRSLASKSAGSRAIVLAAGAFMNAVFPLLALVILAVLFMFPRDVTLGQIRVMEVAPGSPAAQAGLQAGDIVAMADGREIQHVADLQRVNELNRGSATEWVILREGAQRAVQITSRDNPPPGQGRTGIQIEMINTYQETRRDSPGQAIQRSASTLWGTLVLMGQAIAGWFGDGESPQLSGPVGIAQLTGEVTKQAGLAGWFLLAAIFSLNLAVLNILPIPALDGGRLAFVALEWVRRGKRVAPKRENMIHAVGLVTLLGVILLVTYWDVLRLAAGESLLGG
ncbi:MAG: RIP metalloprotease [Dehalococcoidia bacterium]